MAYTFIPTSVKDSDRIRSLRALLERDEPLFQVKEGELWFMPVNGNTEPIIYTLNKVLEEVGCGLNNA